MHACMHVTERKEASKRSSSSFCVLTLPPNLISVTKYRMKRMGHAARMRETRNTRKASVQKL